MARKKAARKPAPKAKAKARTKAKRKAKSSGEKHPYNPALESWITHTELVSVDPK